MLLSPRELFDILVMTLAVGFIFSDFFKLFMKSYHKGHTHAGGHISGREINSLLGSRFDLKAFYLACLITAPAIILHELGHKFIALSLGLSATFHAAYFWLAFGVFLRLMNVKFIFFVPAYVSISNGVGLTPISSGLTAFAGPATNLIMFVAAILAMKFMKVSQRTFAILHFTKQINLFLFIFNMLPIPFFDGMKVYQGLWFFLRGFFGF